MVTTLVQNTELDYSSEEAQYRLLDFYDKLYRSYLCDETWFIEWTLDSWFVKYLWWVGAGRCSALPEGLTGFRRVVPPALFYPCLEELLGFVDDD